ncbi:hypothetical protein ES703_84092 [subsurface metagenome]
MVKIINPLGDVKIGRQGEVVYQRKYGEQIRRQASPKRAMASEAQIAHRQLYRDALAWRKALSLANRRYLEGYCIANGVVDGYHIPLPWSRFALKLYLQAVKFVVITKPVAGEAGEEALFESFDEEPYSGFNLGKATWAAMTFTPQTAHSISKVGKRLRKANSVGTARISIRATDGSGHPTGEDLTGVDFNGDLLPTESVPDFSYFDLAPHQLAQGIKYAIVLRAPNAATSASLGIIRNFQAATYEWGNFELSTDSGASWESLATQDIIFEEYGIIAGKEPVIGLLHVRHPALLAVVHKRGELTINGYDTLSSLDKEYLTGQVGLDVEAGDTIEATTLPGIDYRRKVA